MNPRHFFVALLAVVFGLAAGTSASGHAKSVLHCSGKASNKGAFLPGTKNQVTVDFSCNKGFQKFRIRTNEQLDTAGGTGYAPSFGSCKSDGDEAFDCSGPKTKPKQRVEVTFNTKASNPCSATRLKITLKVSGKKFKLVGPC